MADSVKPATEVPKQAASAAPVPKIPSIPKSDGNPVFRMMGVPRIRAKLPSRNWLIFLSITGSFTTAILYDRHYKKKAQQKWCNIVSHLAQEPLPVNQMPRKITVHLAAPPGDGIRSAREYFSEYVKPILVAAAYDWDVIEGRREGEVRAGIAKKIRELRKKNGEKAAQSAGDDEDEDEDLVAMIQKKGGIQPPDGLGGDLVIGRHTWKEYVRGLHEGWLGPVDPPPVPTATPVTVIHPSIPSDTTQGTSMDDLTAEKPAEGIPEDPITPPAPTPEAPKKAVSATLPCISPSDYRNAHLAATMPDNLPPVIPLRFPHILGFFNTPIRMKRYLTQRYLADDIGHIVADMILAPVAGTWESNTEFVSSVDPDSPSGGISTGDDDRHNSTGAVVESGKRWEQETIIADEESDWHKSARAPNPEGQADKERVWMEDMVIDERIGERMRTFVMTSDEEERVRGITATLAEQERQRKGLEVSLSWMGKAKRWAGWEEEETGKHWKDGLIGTDFKESD